MAGPWDNVNLPSGPTPASYGGRLVDFSGIGNLYSDYAQGQAQQQQLNLMNMFKGGLPTDAQGNIDQGKLIDAYLKAKGGEAVPGMLQQLLRQRAISANESEGQAPFMPSTSAGAGSASRVAENTPQTGEDTMRGGPPVQQATEGMISAVPDSGPNAGRNIAPEVNAAGARTMPGADLVPPSWLAAGRTPQQYADYALRQARNYELAGFPEAGRTWQARGQAVLDTIKQSAEITPEQKEARAAGMSAPDYQSFKKTSEAAGEATGKRIGEVITEGGAPARTALNAINVMDDAFTRAGNHLFTGPGAEHVLHIKQAAANWFGADLRFAQGVAEADTITKLNAQLAAASAKAMTARPSQLEFLSFQKNNPGLMNSAAGSKILLSILRQTNQQKIDLGRLAMDPRNRANWAAVEDAYYKAHPIETPFAVQPPAHKIEYLKAHPDTAKQFDEVFGLGSAARVLR
jgi:hypothetical protein